MNRLQRATFSIDSIPNMTFVGYTDADDWNGWACPYFERKEAETVLRASESNNYKWFFDTERDAFIVRSTDDPEDYEPEIFRGVVVNVEGSEIKVYPIGAYSWIWETVVDEQM